MDLPLIPEDERLPRVYPLEFWTAYDPDPTNPGELRSTDWVRYTRKGTNGATNEEKISRLSKGDGPVWQVLKRFYEAWKAKQSAPIDGTPLDAWPGVTPQQAKVLQNFNLMSVEDIAHCSDSDLMKVPLPAIRDLQKRARAFVEAGKTKAIVAAEIEQRDQQIAAQSAELVEMREMIADLKRQVEKTGRGKAA